MAKKNIKPRVRVPKTLKKGEVFEVKTLVTHVMETGRRKDKDSGQFLPRDILNGLTVTYGGKEVLKSVWHPGLSPNPYTAFYVTADKSGPMVLTWTDDAGETYTKEVAINVQG